MTAALQRRQVNVVLAGLLLNFGAGMSSARSPALASDTTLPIPDSLLDIAQAAARIGQPLVLLISLPGCPYCELVRRNYLLPARANGLPVWQINMADKLRPLVGFDRKTSHAAEQIAHWKIRLAPTLLFLNPKGMALAERLVGIASVDFYGAYLDERLAIARQAVRAEAEKRL